VVRASRLVIPAGIPAPQWTEDPHALKPEAMGSMKNNKLAGTLISRMLLYGDALGALSLICLFRWAKLDGLVQYGMVLRKH
jgi:hypothetical protein